MLGYPIISNRQNTSRKNRDWNQLIVIQVKTNHTAGFGNFFKASSCSQERANNLRKNICQAKIFFDLGVKNPSAPVLDSCSSSPTQADPNPPDLEANMGGHFSSFFQTPDRWPCILEDSSRNKPSHQELSTSPDFDSPWNIKLRSRWLIPPENRTTCDVHVKALSCTEVTKVRCKKNTSTFSVCHVKSRVWATKWKRTRPGFRFHLPKSWIPPCKASLH